MLELIEQYDLIQGFGLVLWLALWGGFWALILGTILAIMRLAPVRILNVVGGAIVTAMRNTPLTLIILGANVVLWIQLGIELASSTAQNNIRLAILGLAIYHASFVCEALRSGVNTIPVGQAEAARSIGLTFSQSLRHVILPQAFRGAITPLGNVMIALTKNTTVAAVIGVTVASHSMRRMIEFRPDMLFEIFFLVALGFVIITLPMGLLTSWASQRWVVKR